MSSFAWPLILAHVKNITTSYCINSLVNGHFLCSSKIVDIGCLFPSYFMFSFCEICMLWLRLYLTSFACYVPCFLVDTLLLHLFCCSLFYCFVLLCSAILFHSSFMFCFCLWINSSHEFHETCHSVTFLVLVNSHQR